MSTQDTTPSAQIKLKNVRLSFPALFTPTKFGDEVEAKYKAVFLLDKKTHAALIAEVQTAIANMVKTAKVKTIASYKTCLRDGAEKPDVDGYGEGVMFISASNKKNISVVGRDLVPLTEASGRPYAGCYVNASIRLWLQDNKWGKRVNAQLQAVQFYGEGEVFGEKAVDPETVFENLEDGIM